MLHKVIYLYRLFQNGDRLQSRTNTVKYNQTHTFTHVIKTSIQKVLFIDGVRLYNDLPDCIKVSPSLPVFKPRVRNV